MNGLAGMTNGTEHPGDVLASFGLDDTSRPDQAGVSAFWDGMLGTTLKLALIFWASIMVVDSIIWSIVGVDPIKSFIPKLVLNTGGALVTIGITWVLHRWRQAGLWVKVVLAFVLATVAAPIYAWIEFEQYRWHMRPQHIPFDFQHFGSTTNAASAMFFGWACLYIALVYSFDVRDRERKLAAAREEALGAQMRALRYQINPHFLFNTLNSIAGLIEEGAEKRAGTMVLSLSTFLRTTLELDPLNDVLLGDELMLQEEYLAIECERFPDRMNFTIDADDDARRAMVPSLILQPLVENAIKHGVGRSRAPVEIRIIARKNADQLWLAVENDLGLDRKATSGFGIGLRNVSDRIAARFGAAGRFSAGPVDERIYRAEIELPWSMA